MRGSREPAFHDPEEAFERSVDPDELGYDASDQEIGDYSDGSDRSGAGRVGRGRADAGGDAPDASIRAEAEALFGGAPMSVNPSARPGAEAHEDDDPELWEPEPEASSAPEWRRADAERLEDERWERARLSATASLREARDSASDAEIIDVDPQEARRAGAAEQAAAEGRRAAAGGGSSAATAAQRGDGPAPAADPDTAAWLSGLGDGPPALVAEQADPSRASVQESMREPGGRPSAQEPQQPGAASEIGGAAPGAAPIEGAGRVADGAPAASAAAATPGLATDDDKAETSSARGGALDPFATPAAGAEALEPEIDPSSLVFGDAVDPGAAASGAAASGAPASGAAAAGAAAAAPSAAAAPGAPAAGTTPPADEPAAEAPRSTSTAVALIPAPDSEDVAAPTTEEEQDAARRAEVEKRAAEEAERVAFVEENSLGSLLYGARATMGMHDLKEVERALRIKARYLKAIEEVDPANLPSDAYLPGYVKSYAAYLRKMLPLGPEEALAKFRRELAIKRGEDPAAAASAGRTAPADRPAPTVSEKVAPRISRAALVAARGGAGVPARRDGSDEPAASGRRPTSTALAPPSSRKTPADRLRERAAEARAAEDPVMRAQRTASLDPLARVERLGDEARAAAGAGMRGKAAAEVTAARRKAAMEREALRAAEVAKANRASRALRTGAEPRQVNAIGSSLAVLTAVAVLGGLAYGAWSLLGEAQRVTAEPDAAPLTVVERIDPGLAPVLGARPAPEAYEAGGALAEAPRPGAGAGADGPLGAVEAGGANLAAVAAQPRSSEPPAANAAPPLANTAPPAPTAPQGDGAALDVLDDALAAVEAALSADTSRPEAAAQPVTRFALRGVGPSLVRVLDGNGATVFSGLLAAGAEEALDPAGGPYTVRADDPRQVAFRVNGGLRGPLGPEPKALTTIIDPARVMRRFPALLSAAAPGEAATVGAN